ncbi:N-acetyldiaminopimelate deacetylase [Roseibaca ekhonensis]|uniref:N-acetyldiaminopimelate deacetylase n=1 Tax=Roseinatronobacter ekhonensis TaxID=254356 RepID=A0A3B0M2P5_9RHOB|nr:amidohydrolase [Roseibaca ekhonensis]SUZ30432.1 N-acetyldiaminopimelate deacetylase [Roseibaca ekhonensis]
MSLDLSALRQALHRQPDPSGQEGGTARIIADALRGTAPDRLVTGLGGHGVAAVYDSGQPGPTVMFRAELDALPITEASGVAHASDRPGVAHLCGHDGHMAILTGLAGKRPQRGRMMLLFQPAEETGAGARAVLADPAFTALRPDYAFALHNMPGLPLGAVAVAAGPASCASVGWRIAIAGREAHAAFPETGNSPAPFLARLVDHLAALPHCPDAAMATLCHLSMGAPAFGIAPGQAVANVTLRSNSDAGLARLETDLQSWLDTHAGGLSVQITRHDHFNATVNDPIAAAHVNAARASLGIEHAAYTFPMRPSEDFGAFSAHAKCALFFLGAGETHPALHDPAYDFPDALIAPGVAMFGAILAQVMG